MIKKLNELKEKSEEVIGYNNSLRRITNSIIAPSYKKVIVSVFAISFVIVFILMVFRLYIETNYSSYNIFQLLFGNLITSLILSLIVNAILAFPIIIFLRYRRVRAFNKFKPEIDIILNSLKIIYSSLNDYPLELEDFLDTFYLDMLIEFIEKEDMSLEEAIKKLRREKRSNKKIQFRSRTSDKRLSITSFLFKLSMNENATSSYKKWIESYSK